MAISIGAERQFYRPTENTELPVVDDFRLEVAQKPEEEHSISVFTSDDPERGGEVKRAAQALHTRVYLKEGFIDESQINEDGLYLDEYSNRSTYYFVINGKKDVVARQINATKKDGLLSLPTFQKFVCDPEKVKEVAGVERITDLAPSEVVEISALSSERKGQLDPAEVDKPQNNLDAVPFLYAQMLRDSVEKGHKLWITNMEESLVKSITGMIGSEQLIKVGEPKAYMGPPTTPYALNPQATIEAILKSKIPYMDIYKNYIKTVFKGVNVDKVPAEFAELLEEFGIETSRESFVRRKVLSREGKIQIAAQTAMLGYSVGRIVPLMRTEEFQGSNAAFLGIDLATSVPYTYGALKMFNGKSPKDKLIGAALAIPSFIAPYAYYYAQGEGYPTKVNVYVGALVLGALGKEVGARIAARRRGNKIERIMTADDKRELYEESRLQKIRKKLGSITLKAVARTRSVNSSRRKNEEAIDN